jgi:hypothetical protein
MRVSADQAISVGSLICILRRRRYEALLLITVQVRSFARVSTTAAACRDGDDERDVRYDIDHYDDIIASANEPSWKVVVLDMRA